jgi:putative spermidine/putrescine transport system substrate-binding protein
MPMRTTWRFDRKRRTFLRTAGRAAAGAALGPLLITERTIAQTRTLYINSWGGSYTVAQDVAYFKPFTAATGIQIRTITPVSYGKIKAQVQSGRYEFDLTSVNSMLWLRASREGLAEPIDWTIIDKATLSPDAVVANGHGIASNIQGTNLCYRRDRFPNGGPRSWADFWDVKRFPGARGLCISDPPRNMIFALLADGVPREQLYPLDVERAFKKLDEIKPHIKVWWREGNQSQQLLRDGEVDMMSIWNGRATELIQQPRARLGADQICLAAQAAGRVQQAALLRPDRSRRLRLHLAGARGAASDPSRQPRGLGARGRRMGGRPHRRHRGALPPMADVLKLDW